MRIVGLGNIQKFLHKHEDSKQSFNALHAELLEHEWNSPHELKLRFPKASIIGNSIVVFNVKNNEYRLQVLINYQAKLILIQRMGTHKEYMKWKY